MVDNLSVDDRRKTMRAVKGSQTSLERCLFSMLAQMGLHGWRKNAKDILGKPDVVFDKGRVAIFVDGCFWHGCPICKRKLPASNREYWERKITRNIQRGESYNQLLSVSGWIVIRIWEHEIRNPSSRSAIRARIREAL
jgi:DNA mismatch endonuclease (patch repair protein)